MSTNPPPKLKRPVRSHKKSRMGCLQCKKRRVKCDEVQPTCGNCSRRAADCVYEPFLAQRRAQQSSQSSSAEDTRQISQSSSLTPLPSGSSSGIVQKYENVERKVTIRQQPTPAPFSSMDMSAFKLLHHYSTVTCPSIAYSRTCLESLQYAVPNVAFSTPGLMHALMSVASLHLSRLYIDPTTSDQDYHSLALSHKSLGCKMLSQATDPDAHFLSLSFLGIFHFVYSTTVPDIFKLISGVHTSLNTIQGVSKGELMPLSLTYNGKFERDSFGNIVTEFGNIDYTDCGLPFLSILTHIHLPSPNYPDPDEVADPETSEAYRRAAQTLGDCWSLFQKPG
ncbi:hypothetical protein V5O48_017926, partial [Marasmius crinis-equi]